MARAIDADEFMKEIRKWLGNETDFRSLQEIIAGMPTIDTVKQEWISVKDRLPEEYTRVLTYSHADGVMIGGMDCDGEFYFPYCLLPDEPTHWMPLPEPPKEGE